MMTRLMDWLEEESGVPAMFGYAVLAGLMIVALQQMVQAAMENWELVARPEKLGNPFEYMGKLQFIEIAYISPMLEELFFRLLPLAIVIGIVSKNPWIVFGFTLAFAVLFGAIHPYELASKVNIMIGGFFFGLVFMKCGGLKKKFLKATTGAILAHSATNILILGYAWWVYQVSTGR
jgi:hypothetical protein